MSKKPKPSSKVPVREPSAPVKPPNPTRPPTFKAPIIQRRPPRVPGR